MRGPPPEPHKDEWQRNIQPGDRVGGVSDKPAQLAVVAAVDHPASLRSIHRRLDCCAKLVVRWLRPVGPVVQGVELDVRHAKPTGKLRRERRLARAAVAANVYAGWGAGSVDG